MQGTYLIYIRAENGAIVQIVNDYTDLYILDTLNDVGQWSMKSVSPDKCPFEPNNGIIVFRNGVCIYSGFVTTIQDTFDISTKLHSWQVNGVNDLGFLARRICFVDPSTESPTANSYYTDSGDIAQVIERLINENAGTRAMDGRRNPVIREYYPVIDLSINISISLRFQNLLKAIQAICLANNCGIRSVCVGTESRSGVFFQTFLPRNLSNTVYFAEYLNNISQSEYIAKVPDGNWILAGGTGELSARSFATAQNTASINQWGRIEVFQDARNQSNLNPYVTDVLAKKSDNMIGYSLTASDADNAPQYGVDYLLGDYVGANVMGQIITAQIQQIEIQVADGVEHITPKFGTLSIGKFREIFQQLDNMQENMNELLGVEIA